MTPQDRHALDQAFTRIRDLDAPITERIAVFVEEVRRYRPDQAAAVDRLIARLERIRRWRKGSQGGTQASALHAG